MSKANPNKVRSVGLPNYPNLRAGSVKNWAKTKKFKANPQTMVAVRSVFEVVARKASKSHENVKANSILKAKNNFFGRMNRQAKLRNNHIVGDVITSEKDTSNRNSTNCQNHLTSKLPSNPNSDINQKGDAIRCVIGEVSGARM